MCWKTKIIFIPSEQFKLELTPKCELTVSLAPAATIVMLFTTIIKLLSFQNTPEWNQNMTTTNTLSSQLNIVFSQWIYISRYNISDNDVVRLNSMFVHICVFTCMKSVHITDFRIDISQFNLPRCTANMTGLIKLSYKLHNKQPSHAWYKLTPKHMKN